MAHHQACTWASATQFASLSLSCCSTVSSDSSGASWNTLNSATSNANPSNNQSKNRSRRTEIQLRSIQSSKMPIRANKTCRGEISADCNPRRCHMWANWGSELRYFYIYLMQNIKNHHHHHRKVIVVFSVIACGCLPIFVGSLEGICSRNFCPVRFLAFSIRCFLGFREVFFDLSQCFSRFIMRGMLFSGQSALWKTW